MIIDKQILVSVDVIGKIVYDYIDIVFKTTRLFFAYIRDKDVVYETNTWCDFNNYIIGEILNDEIIQVEDQNLLGQLIIEFSKLD